MTKIKGIKIIKKKGRSSYFDKYYFSISTEALERISRKSPELGGILLLNALGRFNGARNGLVRRRRCKPT